MFSTFHFLAESAGPAVVGIPINNLPCYLVQLDTLAQSADVGRRLIVVHLLGIYLVDIHEQALNGVHERLVGRAL
jgi:hypothetical protein